MRRIEMTIHFTETLYEKLEKIAEKKNLPMTAIIQLACSFYAYREEKKD